MQTANQTAPLPEDYVWIRKGIKAKILSFLTYTAALIGGGIYCKTVLHVSFKNKKVLKKANGGCFLYANHTQPFGDVIIPALALFPKRIYTLCSPSNLGLKGIGKALPFLGALPIPHSLSGLSSLSAAVKQRADEGSCIVIYPEAHVWEYFTGIRPFSQSSFLYPVKQDLPTFCMTAVYTEQSFFKRPKMTVYIDGPFYPDRELPRKDRIKALHQAVSTTMCKRSTLSNVEYIKYQKKNT